MAAELNARDLKLVQYLNEAYGKEKELETSLTAHIQMTTADKAYRKRLQDHLRETKGHARQLKGRIKELGGKAEQVSLPGPEVVSEAATGAVNVANRAVAAVKGQGHLIRGTGEQEKLLKNAKTQYWNEFEEIATYNAIETLAQTVGDRETAQLARAIRREEERMAKFLDRMIPKLTKAVARDEIPAALRNGGGKRRGSSRRTSSASSNGAAPAKSAPAAKRGTAKKGSSSKRRSTKAASAKRGTTKASTAKRGTAKAAGTKRGSAKASTAKRTTAKGSTAKRGSAKRTTAKASSAKRGTVKRTTAKRSTRKPSTAAKR